jgi:RNAse (barnase) inhibitor barstar
MKRTYVIDGSHFSTLEEFSDEINRVLIPDGGWRGNLDAFNDILRGGFGTPEGGFVLRWENSEISRQRLSYPETIRQLQLRLQKCHPTNRKHVAEELARAQQGRGPTVFDWLVEIIEEHGPGGSEAEGGVELQLK